jgi:hypothetical protein
MVIFGIFPIISVTRISLFIFLNLEIIFNGFPFSFLFRPSRPAHSFGLGLPGSPNRHHPGPPGFVARLAQAAHDPASSPTSGRCRAPPPPRPGLCRRYAQAAMARLPPLARDVLHYSTNPDVISPLIYRLNRPVKAAMNTIRGRAFVLRRRPLLPPQRSIPAYKRRPPLPGPLHTLGHHSFALFPRFHELPLATSLPILPRPPCPTLWCVPCSINHRGRFSTSRSPSPDHSSDRRLDEAPPPPSTSNHRRLLSSPAKSYHSTAQI